MDFASHATSHRRHICVSASRDPSLQPTETEQSDAWEPCAFFSIPLLCFFTASRSRILQQHDEAFFCSRTMHFFVLQRCG